MRDFRKIEAWQLADDLAVAVYQTSRTFPREELYGLTNQLRRAAASVPANIVEGSARDSQKEYLHFLYIARGSLAETQYFIHLARRLEYLSVSDAATAEEQGRRTYACLHGLIRAVEKDAGKFTRIAATVTSLLAIGALRLSVSTSQSI